MTKHQPQAGLFDVPDDFALRLRWRDLVERRLPAVAAGRPDWPVRLDHCFARTLLDNACDRPWREVCPPPAWRSMPVGLLGAALALGERVLEGTLDLDALNRRSLALRGKTRALRSNPNPAARDEKAACR